MQEEYVEEESIRQDSRDARMSLSLFGEQSCLK